MSHLPQILVALLVQAASESGFALSLEMPWAALPLAALPHSVAWIVMRAVVRGRFALAERLDLALRWSGNLAHAVLVLACGWGASVAAWTDGASARAGWPTYDLALLFAPFVVYEVASIDARARLVAHGSQRASIRRFQLRMFASTILPIALYVAVATLIALVEPLRVRIDEIALWRALFGAALLGSLALFVPALLRRTWETEPLPAGAQKDLLLSVARMAGFEHPKLYVWRTGHTTANAAIVGLTPKSRVVLFSDSLLAQMPPNELAAVFAHEMGHAFRWHVPIFGAWALALLLGAQLAAETWFPADELYAGAVFAGGALLWLLSFGWMSRRFELEADLFSLDLLGETRSLVAALERVGGRLRDVAGWRHFSTAERVRFLEAAQLDARVGQRLRRSLKRVTWLGIALLCVVATLHARAAWRTFDEDSVRADLRLGRYESAVERASRAPTLAPLFGSLLDRARELRDGASVEDLCARAREAHARGALAEAFDWHELIVLRSEPDVCAAELHALGTVVALPPDLESRRQRLRAAANRGAH